MSDNTDDRPDVGTTGRKKMTTAPDDQRTKYLADVIQDMDLDQLESVEVFEFEGDPDLIEVVVKGRLKNDIGRDPQPITEDPDDDDDAWDRAKGVI